MFLWQAGWRSKPLKTSLQQSAFLCQLVICCFKYIQLISKLLINSCKTMLYLFRHFHQISSEYCFLFFLFFFLRCGTKLQRDMCLFWGGCFLNSPFTHSFNQYSQQRQFLIKQLFSEAARHQLLHVSENGSMNSGLSSVCSHLYLLICLFLSFFENEFTADIWRRTWDDLVCFACIPPPVQVCARAGVLLCFVGLFSRVIDWLIEDVQAVKVLVKELSILGAYWKTMTCTKLYKQQVCSFILRST